MSTNYGLNSAGAVWTANVILIGAADNLGDGITQSTSGDRQDSIGGMPNPSVGSPQLYDCDFGSSRTFTAIVAFMAIFDLGHEAADGETNSGGYYPKSYKWTYDSGGGVYVDISGTDTTGNFNLKKTHTFSAITASKIRCVIYEGHSAYGYCGFNEVQVLDSIPDSTAPSDVSGTPTATPVSSSQINCDWADATDNIAVTDYKLDRATDSGFTTNLVSGDIGSSTSAKNVTGLSANTTYYFRVKAKDGAGNYSASWSSTFSATTWNVAPTMTNGTTLTTAHQGISYDETITTTGGNGTLTVTLKSGSSYPGGLSLSANHLVGTPTTVGSYSFTFVVTDSNGQNSEKTFNLTVDDTTPPADMTLGAVTTISASQLNVAFTTPTDNVSVTSLKVQRCQVNTFSGGTLVEFTGVSTSSPYTSTGLSENTTYYYRAKAFDGTNYSTNWSNTVNGTTAYIAPVSGFTLSTPTLEAGDTLSITDTSTGTSRTYQWRIGASPTVVSTSATPNLTPNLDNGIIAIKQTVTNPGGISEVTHNVEVVPKIVSVGNVLTKSISSLSLASGHVFKFRVRSKNSQDVYSDYSNQV